ncbi:MAG TPA: hypothetical protein ENN80_08215, partial [Candidatus Hydrogenedentes bacterium]|nr:hypothetical protein [Candidatus Hydrogenedentota bacterium]
PEPLPEVKPLILGVRWPRAELRERIAVRLRERLDAGMVAEVEALRAQGVPWEKLDWLGLEYRFIGRYLQGRFTTEETMFDALHTAICQFAKRQETWFRRMERRGTAIHWVKRGSLPDAVRIAGPYIAEAFGSML